MKTLGGKSGGGRAAEIGSPLDDLFDIHQRAFEAANRQIAVNGISPSYPMCEARYSKTTLAHDNVYAIQGLLARVGAELPTPDYSKAVADVYREATVVFLKAEGTLEILQQVHSVRGSQSLQPLASWVPNWS